MAPSLVMKQELKRVDPIRAALATLLLTPDGAEPSEPRPTVGLTGFVVGDRYSLADLIVSGVVLWSQVTGLSTADHPHVGKWLGRRSARPAIKTEWGM